MTNSVGLLNPNDSLWLAQMQLLDSAVFQAVLQAHGSGMRSRRTAAFIHISSHPLMLQLNTLQSLKQQGELSSFTKEIEFWVEGPPHSFHR